MNEDIRLHLLHLVNKFRGEHGKRPLSLDELVSHFAKMHSEHRIDRMHEILEGRLPMHADPHLRAGLAENVGYQEGFEHPYQLVENVFSGWLESEGHRKNILDAGEKIGVDAAFRQHGRKKRVFVTARFR